MSRKEEVGNDRIEKTVSQQQGGCQVNLKEEEVSFEMYETSCAAVNNRNSSRKEKCNVVVDMKMEEQSIRPKTHLNSIFKKVGVQGFQI